MKPQTETVSTSEEAGDGPRQDAHRDRGPDGQEGRRVDVLEQNPVFVVTNFEETRMDGGAETSS